MHQKIVRCSLLQVFVTIFNILKLHTYLVRKLVETLTLQQPYTTEITSLLIKIDLFAQPMNYGFSHTALMPTG
jgi:hypothetical protein